jgi:hypothetical protein
MRKNQKSGKGLRQEQHTGMDLQRESVPRRKKGHHTGWAMNEQGGEESGGRAGLQGGSPMPLSSLLAVCGWLTVLAGMASGWEATTGQ